MSARAISRFAAILLVAGPGALPQETRAGSAGETETRSLLGEDLRRLPLPDEERVRRETQFERARAAAEAGPGDLGAWIWYGRRAAALGRFRDSVEIFTRALGRFPEDPRILRHRGHRFITLRRFDLAVADLARAAELSEHMADEEEPPVNPNPRNVILDTLKQSVHYHLGLAHFLRADFASAAAAFETCRTHSTNPDALVSVTHWLYLTLRRLGRHDDARAALDQVRSDADVIENHAYRKLVQAWKSEIRPDDLWDSARAGADGTDLATIGAGVGFWHLASGREARAREIWTEVLRRSPWPAFGRIAAEAAMARLAAPR